MTGRDDEDDDGIAAEAVLGTLGPDERAAAEERRRADARFDDAARAWEERLSPLADVFPEVEPPAGLYDVIRRRVFGESHAVQAPGEPAAVSALRRSRMRWRAASGALAALAAALLVWIGVQKPQAPDSRFVAVLQKDATSPAMVLDLDMRARTLTVRPVSTDEPAQKSLELWIVNPEIGGARSLGVVSPDGLTRASLAPYDASQIARATYAVTLEPLGGSPNGQPSGTPILSGKLSILDR